MKVIKRARSPSRERWPTQGEFLGDVMASRLLVGACCVIMGAGMGVTATLGVLGVPGAWHGVAAAFVLVAVLSGGCLFVAFAFYEQEVRPRSDASERLQGAGRFP